MSKSRKATTSACGTRCSTASVPTYTPAGAGGSSSRAGDRDDRPAGRRLELLAQPGHARPQVGERRPAALLAHRRARRAAARAGERPVVGQADRGLAPLAAGQRPARPAGEEPGPARRVVHAHDRRGRGRAGGRSAATSRATSSTARRGCGRRPRRSASRPARRRSPAAPRRSPTAARPITVGHGDTSSTGAPARAARSTTHVAGVPRRAALLLQRLVVLVDDDGGGEVRARRPRRRPRRRSRRRRRPPRAAHSCGHDGDGQPGAPQPGGVEPGRGRATARRPAPARAPAAASSTGSTSSVGGSRSTPPPPPSSARGAGRGRLRPRARAAARRQPGDVRRRAGGDEERPQPPGRPADRRPAGEVDQLGRRTTRADLGDRPQAVDVERPVGAGRARRPSRRRAGRAAARAPSSPTRDVERQRVGHDVVELLVEPGDVGQRPGRCGRPGSRCAQAPTAALKSSRRLVCSHVKPGSGRPKWP